ncbi:DUF2164 domain-containing protein [Candidatus Eisenbacteria bacterium]|uniref:DUF2164 domain-containing protein n=1 Tax=Eiseniibacteriota bacterium TaxID=2212470 RepID=A0ABV6YJN1_UNCEI
MIELQREASKELKLSIQRFFREQMDDDIGDLKAELFLDFCLKEICPTVYNRAVRDAQAYFQERTADLDGSCYEPERVYWEKK